MNAEEKKCWKAMGAGHRERERQHRENGDEDAAECHGGMAAACEKAAALPADAQGGSGKHSDVQVNLDGDAQAKRSTQEIDSLLQKDRSDEFGKAVPADPIGDLTRELAL
jgi:hypothetical protein